LLGGDVFAGEGKLRQIGAGTNKTVYFWTQAINIVVYFKG
jgi:hypothetical protein